MTVVVHQAQRGSILPTQQQITHVEVDTSPKHKAAASPIKDAEGLHVASPRQKHVNATSKNKKQHSETQLARESSKTVSGSEIEALKTSPDSSTSVTKSPTKKRVHKKQTKKQKSEPAEYVAPTKGRLKWVRLFRWT